MKFLFTFQTSRQASVSLSLFLSLIVCAFIAHWMSIKLCCCNVVCTCTTFYEYHIGLCSATVLRAGIELKAPFRRRNYIIGSFFFLLLQFSSYFRSLSSSSLIRQIVVAHSTKPWMLFRIHIYESNSAFSLIFHHLLHIHLANWKFSAEADIPKNW